MARRTPLLTLSHLRVSTAWCATGRTARTSWSSRMPGHSCTEWPTKCEGCGGKCPSGVLGAIWRAARLFFTDAGTCTGWAVHQLSLQQQAECSKPYRCYRQQQPLQPTNFAAQFGLSRTGHPANQPAIQQSPFCTALQPDPQTAAAERCTRRPAGAGSPTCGRSRKPGRR